MALSFQLLNTDSQLQLYIDRYRSISHNPLDLDYLKTASVYAFYNSKTQEMVGGFVINTSLVKRYVFMLEPSDQERVSKLPFLKNSLEVTCIWFDKSYSTIANRFHFYSSLFTEIQKSGCEYVIGGSISSKVKDLQMKVLDHLLLESETSYRKKPVNDKVWLYCGKTKGLYMRFLKIVPYEAYRMFRKGLVGW